MAGWLPGGRDQAQRLDSLEGEVQRLRAQLSGVSETLEAMALANANQATALTLATAEIERLRGLPASVLELETRLAGLEDIAGPEAIKFAEDRAKADAEALTKMRAAILRAELQLENYAEESRKTGSALLERIELLRLYRPLGSASAEREPASD